MQKLTPEYINHIYLCYIIKSYTTNIQFQGWWYIVFDEFPLDTKANSGLTCCYFWGRKLS